MTPIVRSTRQINITAEEHAAVVAQLPPLLGVSPGTTFNAQLFRAATSFTPESSITIQYVALPAQESSRLSAGWIPLHTFVFVE